MFKINQYLELRLEAAKTIIYVSDQKFTQCKLVVFNLLPDQILSIDNNLKSMDEFLSQGFTSNIQNKSQISPEEEFWVHCSNIHTWSLNSYDTSLLDSYLAFPLLKKLADAGDLIAKRVFKEEISKRLKTNVPQVLRFLLNEKYDLYLTQEELLSSILNTEDSIALSDIASYLEVKYYLVFQFDDLREKFLNIYRSQEDLYNYEYYFSALNGRVLELELFMNKNHALFPRTFNKFKKLERLYLYLDNLGQKMIDFNIKLESLLHLKIFCFGMVKLSNILQNFPNLKSLEIYGEGYGLTQLEVTDDSLEYFKKIRCVFKFVIFLKLI